MPADIYFKQIQHPMSQRDAVKQIYFDPTAEQVKNFKLINGLTNETAYLYPGHLLLIPGSSTNDSDIPAFCPIEQRANFATRHSSKPPAPGLFNESFPSFLYSQSPDIGIEVVKNFTSEGGKEFSKLLQGMSSDLSRLNTSYLKTQTAVRGSADLAKKAPRFSAFSGERAIIYNSLQEKMRRVPPAFNVMKSGAASAKDALNINHMDVKRAFKARGVDSEIKKISDVIDKASDMSKKVANGGKYFGYGLQVVGGAVTAMSYQNKVNEFEKRNPKSADVLSLREGGKAIGGVIGGAAGGELGLAAGAGLVLLMGTPVGWASIAVIGIAAVAGGAVGGYLGSTAGDHASVAVMKEIDPSRSQEIDMIVEADNAGTAMSLP